MSLLANEGICRKSIPAMLIEVYRNHISEIIIIDY